MGREVYCECPISFDRLSGIQVFRLYVGPIKRFREMNATHVGGHGLGLPWLGAIQNSSKLRGLCCRSCFGPRMCDRGITNIQKTFRGSQSRFPLLTPTMQAGQDSDGGVGVLEGMCAMRAGVRVFDGVSCDDHDGPVRC